MQPLFSDSKTFADATPRCLNLGALWPSGAVAQRPCGRLAVWPCACCTPMPKGCRAFGDDFVAEHLEPGVLQSLAADEGRSASLPLRAHIRRLWPHLLRCAALKLPPGGSLLPLSQACAVPRRRFRECCWSNTYFTLLGLVEDGRRDLAEAMLQNTAHQTDNLGPCAQWQPRLPVQPFAATVLPPRGCTCMRGARCRGVCQLSAAIAARTRLLNGWRVHVGGGHGGGSSGAAARRFTAELRCRRSRRRTRRGLP